jgi:hypothetical protein
MWKFLTFHLILQLAILIGGVSWLVRLFAG